MINNLLKKITYILEKRKPSYSGQSKLILLAFSLLFANALQAHPHSWVNMQTEIQGNATHITGLQMHWEFDAMTSAYMLDDLDLPGKQRVQAMLDLKNQIINNMHAEDYFTYFYHGESLLKYKQAKNVILKQDKGKLILSFELLLAQPQPLSSGRLKLQVFETSHYVEISWIKKSDIQLSNALAKSCQFELIEPNPSPQEMSYALSLPSNAAPDRTLGQLFAQSIRLNCKTENRNKDED